LLDPVPSMDVGIAWARERELSATATAMLEHFRQSFGEAPG
jgi:hypothetical protein